MSLLQHESLIPDELDALAEQAEARERQRIIDETTAERLALGLTQVQLAERSGVSQSRLSEYANGKVEWRYATIQRIWRGLGGKFSVQGYRVFECRFPSSRPDEPDKVITLGLPVIPDWKKEVYPEGVKVTVLDEPTPELRGYVDMVAALGATTSNQVRVSCSVTA